MRERLLAGLARWMVAHPWRVVAAAVVVSAASVALIPSLEILTSRSALYPPDLDVNRRFQDFLTDFRTTGNLIAVVEGEPDALGPFAEDLAVRLLEDGEYVSGVFYKADVEFFSDRAFLFLSTEQLERLRRAVLDGREQILRLNRLNGLIPVLDLAVEADSGAMSKQRIDLESADQALAAGRELLAELERWIDDPGRTEVRVLENLFLERFSGHRLQDRRGYLVSRDGRMLFLFIQPASNSDEFEYLDPFVARCRAAAAEVSAAWKGRGRMPPAVGFAGLPAAAVEEMTSIRRDVVMTASVAAVGIFLLILVGFRSVRRGVLVFIPLVLAGVWNLGLTALTVGHLTLLTSGFTAILFGLGVDYGIFLSGRIQEERGRGLSNAEAIVVAVRTAGRTLLTAGGTTTAAFFVIGTVEFTGFAELGVVAGTGVVLVMLAMLVLLPALSALVPVPPLAVSGRGPASRSLRPRLPFTGAVTVVALAAAALSVWYALDLPVDFDLRNIMPRDSESVRYQQKMADRSDFQPEFAALIAGDVEQAALMEEKLVGFDTVARIESVTSLLPRDQEAKIRMVRDIEPVFDRILVPRGDFEPFTAGELADRLDEAGELVEEAQEKAFGGGRKELVASLDALLSGMETVAHKLRSRPGAADRARAFEQELFATLAGAVEQTRRWAQVGPLHAEDLPAGLLDRFRGKSGRYALYVFPAGSVYDVDFLDRFLADVYSVAPDATGFPTTHQVFTRMIMHGFRQATLWAAAVVFLLLLVDFRRPGAALSAALPLSVGAAWMFGLMYYLDVPLNYANIIALPLIIGLAVDYGVYVTHRLGEARCTTPPPHPFETMEVAGRPVLLAALTTMLGIGAMCLGEHRGAASLGEALLYGIATCLAAAVIVLPAAVAFVQGLARLMRGSRSQGEGR